MYVHVKTGQLMPDRITWGAAAVTGFLGFIFTAALFSAEKLISPYANSGGASIIRALDSAVRSLGPARSIGLSLLAISALIGVASGSNRMTNEAMLAIVCGLHFALSAVVYYLDKQAGEANRDNVVVMVLSPILAVVFIWCAISNAKKDMREWEKRCWNSRTTV